MQPGNYRGWLGRFENGIGLGYRRYYAVFHPNTRDVGNAAALFVEDICNTSAVRAEIPIVNVPFRLGNYGCVLAICQIDINQALKLRIPIGCDENPFAIFGEARSRIGDFLSAFTWPGCESLGVRRSRCRTTKDSFR